MQVADDFELLELMLKDIEAALDIYKPTNCWIYNQKKLLPELKRLGLHDFKRRKNSFLSYFGATDLLPSFARVEHIRKKIFSVKRKLPFLLIFLPFYKLYRFFKSRVLKISPTPYYYGFSLEDLRELAYNNAKMQGEKNNAKSIDEFEASTIGNPEDIFSINGKTYTMSMLYYYTRYAYCSNFIDFNNVEVLVELGSGSGKQVELIKKLHPDICFLLFDIPPQLYVCEQYLKKVFRDSVVSYKETREMETIHENKKGKIFIFGNWKFPVLEKIKIDLFWNTASFQEMEPEIVLNYLKYINKQANAVYLQEIMDGISVAQKKGDLGVLKKTTIKDYKNGLSSFKLLSMSLSLTPLGKLPGYNDSFWKHV